MSETECATCNVVWEKPFLNHLFDEKHCLYCLMHSENESDRVFYCITYNRLNKTWLNSPEGKEYTKELKKKGEGII